MAEEEIPRNPAQAIMPCLSMIFLYLLWYNWKSPESVSATLMGIGTIGITWLVYMGASYSGEGSKLHGLKPIIGRMPTVQKPEGHVHFRTKMTWTLAILIVYFAMTNVALYGLGGETIDLFSQYRAILAGASGSLMHLGIGPIVTGSIIMQLFTGAKIINLNLQDPRDKEIYQGTQKVLVIVMIIVESVPQVFGFLEPSSALVAEVGLSWARMTIITQLAIGSYLVFLMDESVSKWGIGSGISLFIAAGVSQAIFTGTLNWEPAPGSGTETPSGTLPMILWYLKNSSTSDLSGGGYEAILLAPPNPLVALIGTFIVFLIVVYVESSRIELPLAHGKVRGARGRYPIRLIYASNIPVILMAALLANLNMFTLLFWSHPTMSTVPILGSQGAWSIAPYLGSYDVGQTQATDGFAWYASMVNGVGDWLLPLLNQSPDPYGHSLWQVVLHVITYVTVMTLGSMMFAKFWIETTNMGAKDVAKQIENTGMQIPGFRKNPKVLERILMRYIPPVTLFSGAFVGLLAAGADLLGTVGNATGTGLLLAVGIILRTYEQIQKEQAMEMHPVLREFFGAE